MSRRRVQAWFLIFFSVTSIVQAQEPKKEWTIEEIFGSSKFALKTL